MYITQSVLIFLDKHVGRRGFWYMLTWMARCYEANTAIPTKFMRNLYTLLWKEVFLSLPKESIVLHPLRILETVDKFSKCSA